MFLKPQWHVHHQNLVKYTPFVLPNISRYGFIFVSRIDKKPIQVLKTSKPSTMGREMEGSKANHELLTPLALICKDMTASLTSEIYPSLNYHLKI